MGFCLSVTSLHLQRTGPSGLRAARAGLDNLLYQLKFFFSFKLIEVIKETNLMHWLKRNQNGPMWLKYDPKCYKMAHNGPRRSKK